MKKIFLAMVLIVMSAYSFSQSRNAAGTWLGTLDVGVKLRLVFQVKSESPGSYTATMESPDQGAKGIPVSSVIISGDSLHIEVNAVKGNFDGKFTNDTTVAGSWKQGPAKVALTIVKTKEIIALNRPQTPKPPFNYTSEDVEYSNADNSVHFGGTFTYPASGGPFPTAILITGSGQEDRDETIFEHKPFAVIADYLTKKGFAILRVDDRGVGKTTGEVMTATSADFAKDVEAGLAYLKTRPQTDQSRLGMIGHSEGGLIAALIASKRKDIDFMIFLAGPGTKGAVLLAAQGAAIMKAEGISAESLEAYMPLYNKMIDAGLNAKDTSAAYAKLWSHYIEWKKATPSGIVKELNFYDETSAQKSIRQLIARLSLPWTKYFIESDPAKLIEKTSAKVLALNGEKDVQVLAAPNLAGLKAALQKSKSKVYETKELVGLNHLFQKCTKCSISEYSQLEQTISPDALEAMGNWLDKNVKK